MLVQLARVHPRPPLAWWYACVWCGASPPQNVPANRDWTHYKAPCPARGTRTHF